MTEATLDIPAFAEEECPPATSSPVTAIPHWWLLTVVRWLQHKLSQILSQLHLLSVTRGRSHRWRRLIQQLIQAGMALLLAAGWALSPLAPPNPAYAAAVFTPQVGSSNPLSGVQVVSFSTPTFADLDGDGDLDAFIGEYGGTIKYYQNTGSATSPVFIQRTGTLNPFNGVDVGSYSAPSFADLDGDGDLDAFIGEMNGTIKYFQNTGSVTSPEFIERAGSLNPFNGVDMSYNSAPSFADLDKDGDLDAFSGEMWGTIKYFENTGNATSPAFVERSGNLNPFNGVDVGDFSNPSFADLDGDGDLDAFIGEWNGTIKYYQNIGSATSPAFVERTGSLNPLNGVDVGKQSAPSFANLDGDGDLDAFIGEYGEYWGTIKYYQNIGDNRVQPVFSERSGSLNPFNGMVAVFHSAPSFADLDGDGDLDAFIGESGGTIKYYQNTGSATIPAFIERTGNLNPFNGVDLGSYSAPSFADLDGDGDLDAFIGEYGGTIKYYQNTGSAISPAFVERTGSLNPFNGVNVGLWSSPSFADLDGDGDLDAFIGEDLGTIKYFQNVGSAISPSFVERSGSLNPFNGVNVGYDSKPSFADLDKDGDLDTFIGEMNGTIKYFQNVGSATTPAFVQRSGTLNPFNGVDVGYWSTPSFADLDKDGDLDAFIGKSYEMNYFQNTPLVRKSYLPLLLR
jgi:hypothetical protein